jgi:hypothetical protein
MSATQPTPKSNKPSKRYLLGIDPATPKSIFPTLVEPFAIDEVHIFQVSIL